MRFSSFSSTNASTYTKETDSFRNAIRDAADHAAAVRVPTEDDVRQFFPLDQVQYVHDVRVEIDTAIHEMRTVRHTCQRWRKNIVPLRLQNPSNVLPAPASVPRAMYQNK